MKLGGVIVWSLDMDDKTGSVCNQGPYPVLNTLKNELMKPDPITKASTQLKLASPYPRGFWSKRPKNYRRSLSTRSSKPNFIYLINFLNNKKLNYLVNVSYFFSLFNYFNKILFKFLLC